MTLDQPPNMRGERRETGHQPLIILTFRPHFRLRSALHPNTTRLDRKSAANIESPLPVLASVHPPPPPEDGGVPLPPEVVRVKVAVTVAPSCTVQDPVPLQFPPLQPANMDPLTAVAVSVTLVPGANAAEQVPPQVIPGGLEATVPVPDPARLTVTPNGSWFAAAIASTCPEPKSVCRPRGTALFWRALAICMAVAPGDRLFKRAAIPATCGAAADVPKKGVEKPPAPVIDTPSVAVTSGFNRCTNVGKKMVDGPRLLIGSIGRAGLCAFIAAAANTPGTAAWPKMLSPGTRWLGGGP